MVSFYLFLWFLGRRGICDKFVREVKSPALARSRSSCWKLEGMQVPCFASTVLDQKCYHTLTIKVLGRKYYSPARRTATGNKSLILIGCLFMSLTCEVKRAISRTSIKSNCDPLFRFCKLFLAVKPSLKHLFHFFHEAQKSSLPFFH